MTPPPEDSSRSEVDFTGLVLGLSSSALSYMGVDQAGGTSQSKNLGLAKHNIDIIEMLRSKTEGNLSEDEARLVKQVLTDLRMRFVAAVKP